MDLLMIAGRRNSMLGYVIALVMVGFSFLLRMSAGGFLSNYPYLMFILPVLVASFFGGFGPGLLSALLSAGIVQYVFVSGSASLLPASPQEWIGLLIYLFNSIIIIGLIHSLLTAHREQNLLRAQLMEFNAHLGKLVDERTDALKAEMSEHANAQAQLRQLQKMETIGHLTGGVAHDFNNMLAVIVGSLDIAERRLAKGLADETRQCIGNAREGAKRAAVLTGRLLAFSRQQPLSPEAVDANKLVGGMSEMLRRTLGEEIQIETVLAGGLWTTHADMSQLENAILNLAINARDAMPGGGKLTVETANAELDERYARQHAEVRPGQYVMISLSDSGTGMSPDVIERAFDPFYTTKGPGKGTGLGLSQVFGYVKQTGGHIKIYSEIDRGTTVKIYLPRYVGSATPNISPAVAAALLPRAKRNEIVLVVEDEDHVRHMTVDALRELGYSVIEASGGKDALQQLEMHSHVDLLFTDIVMPEMNGKMVADAVSSRFPLIKVVYTTGYTRNAIVHNGVLNPGVNLITKPFTLEQLAQKLSDVLKHD